MKIEIIPAIDIIEGKCVRLTQGKYSSSKVYFDNPLEVAKMFEDNGAKRLHVVDLDGAKKSGIVNLDTLSKICKGTNLIIDFGGGIKADKDLQNAFDAGADFVCLGSISQKNPNNTKEWLETYKDKIIIGADVRESFIYINGWMHKTDTTINELIEQYTDKLYHLMCTDISKDGTLQGPNFMLYSSIREKYPQLNLIASGGISSIEDIYKLDELGIKSVIVGKAIYESRIDLKELFKN